MDKSPELIKAIWRLAIWAVRVEKPTAAYAVISAGTADGPVLESSAEVKLSDTGSELVALPTRHEAGRCCHTDVDGGAVIERGGELKADCKSQGYRRTKRMPAILRCRYQTPTDSASGVTGWGICWLNGQRMKRPVVV